MTPLKKILATIVCFFTLQECFCQELSLEDLLTVYRLDSTALHSFCTDRKFELVNITEDKWIFVYTYQGATDKKASFIRTFPKDQSANVHLQYYYNDNKAYRKFIQDLKDEGFNQKEGLATNPEIQNNYDYRERFWSDSLEVELRRTSTGKTRRVLLVHKLYKKGK